MAVGRGQGEGRVRSKIFLNRFDSFYIYADSSEGGVGSRGETRLRDGSVGVGCYECLPCPLHALGHSAATEARKVTSRSV